MDDHLETQLRAVLAERAAELAPDAGARLRAVDYRPRSRSFRPRLALGAGAAAGVAVVLTAASLLTGTATTFAGWTAVPTNAGIPSAAADATCRAQLAMTRGPLDMSIGTNWQIMLTDARGPFTWLIYESADASASCLAGPSLVAISGQSGGSGGFAVGSVSAGGTGSAGGSSFSMSGQAADTRTPAAGSVQVSTEHLVTSGGQPYSAADGRIGAGVSGVTLVLSDGSHVEATVANGWFAGWWPSTLDATAIQLTTAAGVTTQPLAAPPVPAACPPQTVCSGGAGGTGGGISVGP